MGQDEPRARPPRAGPASGPTAKSATTPSASATIPGEHTIVFAMLGETIELTVRATNRDCYAAGALAAAKFLAGKPPGRYGMADVLGLGPG